MDHKTTLRKTAIFVHSLASGTYSLSFKKMTERFPQFIWGFAEFGDELLGDEASAATQQVMVNSGYRVLIDPEGKHRMQSSTIKHIAKEIVDKEYFRGIKLQ